MMADQNHPQDHAAEAAADGLGQAAEQGEQLAGAARDGLRTMSDLRDKVMEDTRGVVRSNIELASHQAREVGEQFTRNLGLRDDEGQRLSEQSKQNLQAMARCGTVLGEAYQDVSRDWLRLGQRQWERGIEAMQRLAGARTVHEFTSVQSELMREGLQLFVQDSRAIAERSLRAAEDAGRAFTDAAA